MKIKFILALVIASVNLFGDSSSPYQCQMSGNQLEADIIVVGGGAAGCILMSELSKHFSVLGIEGGPNITGDPAIEAVGLPALLLANTGKYKYFWPGWNQTKPMPGLNGRTSDWTTGLGLGGGSSINGLYYGRGSNAVYSRWEEVSGSSNWSLDKILATFKALENYQGLTMTPGARGEHGRLSVLQTPIPAELTLNALLPATQQAFPGIPIVEDYNDPSVENCIDPRAQWFIQPNGTKRESSATAYLDSSVMTPEGQGVNGHKLFVLFNSVAVQIVFDECGRAEKVKYVQDGQLYEARARKGVVLASGINSSKLLQLSGIGPSKVLKKAGIKPVFINENVGKHLQNHPLIFITMLANPALGSGIPPGAPYSFTIHNVYLPEVGGLASDPRMLQILFEYVPVSEKVPLPLVVIGFELSNPVSEGSTTILSDNSFQLAASDDGFYKNRKDLINMREAVQSYISPLLAQLSVYGIIAVPGDPIYGVILADPPFNNKVVDEYVKNNSNLSLDVHHFARHNLMAPLKAGGVVDGDTRVYGTQNVFVADDSICPVIPDINTAAAAMMIGLHTSKILKHALRKEKSQ
jgi:choline dehydrogenase